jgi:TRAP-type mannitol/chloroaromatic compound transport system permease small subunit
MATLLKIAGVILLCCISPFLIVLAPLFWWGGDASVTTSHTVTDATGDESTGNGCGWLVFGALFVAFAFLVLAGLAVTMPEDCQTIAVNVAMGRCP